MPPTTYATWTDKVVADDRFPDRGAQPLPRASHPSSLDFSPVVVAKRRRCLKMQGLRPRAPQACSKHAEDARLERNAADSGRYGVS